MAFTRFVRVFCSLARARERFSIARMLVSILECSESLKNLFQGCFLTEFHVSFQGAELEIQTISPGYHIPFMPGAIIGDGDRNEVPFTIARALPYVKYVSDYF